MAVNQNEPIREQLKSVPQVVHGWTKIHSWIFVILVALGLALLAFQNRYHYIMPDNTGKAYRISKLTGAIQEYDSSVGWMSSQIAANALPNQPLKSNEPEPVNSEPSAVPMTTPPGTKPQTMPTQETKLIEEPKKEPVSSDTKEEIPSGTVTEKTVIAPSDSHQPASIQPETATQPTQSAPSSHLSREEKYKTFVQVFPDFGEPEFELASEDLFPDWRQKMSPDGTWQQFLVVYRQFIEWYLAQGSPQESGMKLWQDFLTSRE